jgi:hypothetical protein
MFKLSKKHTIIKNLVAINLSFLFIFAAVNSVASIQPVLNQTENLGITSQIVMFSVNTITNLVFPSIVIQLIGFKWTMVLAELFYLTYIAFQALPTWWTLMPTSVLSGFSQSLLWFVLIFTIIIIYFKFDNFYLILKDINWNICNNIE